MPEVVMIWAVYRRAQGKVYVPIAVVPDYEAGMGVLADWRSAAESRFWAGQGEYEFRYSVFRTVG